MTYFLRFTDTANEDLERGTSIHASDYDNNHILDGLCGYMLEADNEEDAIEEIENGIWQFSFVGKAVLYTGKVAQDDNLVPDGDLFIPFEIICEVDYEA
jgi:hypothetical protein